MSDFSDRPFYAGNITGLRAFRVDSLGRLTGVTHKDVWTPGENEAVCHKVNYDYELERQMGAITAAMTGGRRARGGSLNPYNYYTLQKPPKPLRKPSDDPAHVVAGQKCECGFYAYFDGGNDYLTDSGAGSAWAAMYITYGTSDPDHAPRVAAIVNGWGLVTVGSRGFRAAKAEVVALISPKSEQARHEVAFAKVRRNYPGVVVFETEREAVRAFPLTDPEPATPDDEDFWTRSAR